jgi:hypothetical protein
LCARRTTCGAEPRRTKFCPISWKVGSRPTLATTGAGNRGLIPEKEPERRLLDPWIAAGAKIAQFPGGEAVTRHSGGGSASDCDGRRAKISARSDWRASLVPAAAVIPAPEASMCIAAVKRFVVGGCYCEESMVFKAGAPGYAARDNSCWTAVERGGWGQGYLAARGEIQ